LLRAATVRVSAERTVAPCVDGLRASFSRQTGELRGFRRATDRARQRGDGLTTVVMFLLVPQVQLRKRLDVARAAEPWSAQLPALIEQQLNPGDKLPASVPRIQQASLRQRSRLR
jgi:hypothetical protein